METHNCPKCGWDVGAQIASTRMVNCPACGTSLFLQDDRFLLAGEQGVMHDGPMLLRVGDNARLGPWNFRIIGQVRYAYGRGWWDEFWAVDERQSGIWVSVDEGDLAVQTELPAKDWPQLDGPPALGTRFSCAGSTFTVTETETATCDALRGSLPATFQRGEQHRFINATNDEGHVLSGEFWDDGQAWYLGDWFDPFDLRQQGAQ